MKPSILLTIAAITCFSTTLRAAEETSPATRLIEVMNFSKTAKAGATAAFAPMIQQMKAQGMPEEAVKEVMAAADRFFTKTFSDPGIKTDLVKVYEDAYTKEEMEELLTFYETPVGKKSLAAMPQLMQESAVVGQKYAAKNQAEFQAEMQAIMAKHKAKTSEPAPAE